MTQAEPVVIQVPAKLAPLATQQKRYKLVKGGRGGGKSWGVVALLVEMGWQKPLRILCTREVQLSIRDSVMRLISDQIKRAGLQGFYRVLETEIRGINGTLFLFRGLSDQTADSIKSFEGIDICWVEEAQAISQRSLDILLPTIRKPGSEVWFTMNPELETDPVYNDFAARERDDTIVITMGVQDNPWASKELMDQREKAYAMDPKKADWIWGGNCRPIAEGAIYEREMRAMLDAGRACSIPYDPAHDTILAMDLGIGDHTSLVLGQWIGHERRVLHAYESFGVPLSHYIDHLKRSEYRIDQIVLPHDGNSLSLQTGRTPRDLLETAFPRADIQVLPRTPDIEQDINHVRERFGSVWVDKSGASLLIEALKKYRRRKNDRTGLFEKPLHDTFSDMADAFRYWMQAEERRPGGYIETHDQYSEAW